MSNMTRDNFTFFHRNQVPSQMHFLDQTTEKICDKGQYFSKEIYGLLNSSKKRTKLTILSKEDAQDSEFCSIVGRIEDTINCF